jgi:NitT/TauT family transport system substrate-binding protein
MPARFGRGVSRRDLLAAAAGLAGAAALGSTPSASAAPGQGTARAPAAGQGMAQLKVGYIPLLTVGPLFLAHDLGYFRDAGLAVEMVRFNSGAEMVVGLGTGELAAGFAGASPGLFNAWARGVRTVFVADGGRSAPGHSNTLVVVRTDLADEIRRPSDLRGRRVGFSVVGSVIDYMMRNLLEQNGMTLDDVEVVRLPSADVNAGLAGRTLDAAGVGEPFGTMAEQLGIARKWLAVEEIVPGMQVAGIAVSQQALADRAQVVALVTAYLRGVRDFLPGQNSDPGIIEVVNRWSGVQPDIIRRAIPAYMDPNGGMDVDDVRRQQAFWLRHGVIDRAVPVDDRFDFSFAEAALRSIGRV